MKVNLNAYIFYDRMIKKCTELKTEIKLNEVMKKHPDFELI